MSAMCVAVLAFVACVSSWSLGAPLESLNDGLSSSPVFEKTRASLPLPLESLGTWSLAPQTAPIHLNVNKAQLKDCIAKYNININTTGNATNETTMSRNYCAGASEGLLWKPLGLDSNVTAGDPAHGILVASIEVLEDYEGIALHLLLHSNRNARSTFVALYFCGESLRLRTGMPWRAFGTSEVRPSLLKQLIYPNGTADELLTVDRYLYQAINGDEALELFSAAYRTRAALKGNPPSFSGLHSALASGDAATTSGLDFQHVFDGSCLWLLDVEVKSASLAGRMASTCGDKVYFVSSGNHFAYLINRINAMSIFLLFVQALPFLYGIGNQIHWICISRRHLLRMCAVQLRVLLVWSSYNFHTVTVMLMLSPFKQKATSIFLFAMLMIHVLLAMLYLLLQGGYNIATTLDEHITAQMLKNLLWVCLCTWAGGFVGLQMGESVLHPVVVIVASLLFWVPQLLHSFAEVNGCLGFTAPFLFTAALQPIVPMIVASFVQIEPWIIVPRSQSGLLAGATLVALETGVLFLFLVTKGKYILPGWMTPCRYNYRVSCNVLSEVAEGICAICRESLADLQEVGDELWRAPCGHIYHASCLRHWMRERMVCPLCRVPLPEY
ncbi:hypothetical protein DQ04_03291020 [Trypanosoma grayi]|uniref:hypothetical protein n=1 Tax=Trypanosoma grayi TaxID=71804 RepID=UPI0004F4A1F4|nr:hypothetical protein DQ04_03291020 [Trypanosoma grayi]KEG10785.1 hypothetical protein DQ04_03291020 [Trypanosoma grayi]